MTRELAFGSSGDDVRDVQLALNKRPTYMPRLDVDGVFGAKTRSRVKEFQELNLLLADGIVGPKTRGALIGIATAPSTERGVVCGNGESFVAGEADMLAARFLSGGAATGAIRLLDAVQRASATSVYGASLDFSTIFITDRSGPGNRPFTVAVPGPGRVVQIMSCGSLAPSPRTLLHELAHAWQSQHHHDKRRFMQNAVDAQAAAAVASAAATVDDPLVACHPHFPASWPFDASAYQPGVPFASLAAEQMAKAVENGEPAVVTHVRGVGVNAVDASCVTALSTRGFADRRLAGVR